MYSEQDLDAAVADRRMTREAAQALRAHARRRQAESMDDEELRLVSGFGDVFTTVACVLIFLSAGYLTRHVSGLYHLPLVAILAWGLSEYFTRRQRLSLVSIFLVMAFTRDAADWTAMHFPTSEDGELLAATAVGCLAAALHWWRFKVPIAVAIGWAMGVLAVVACQLLLDAKSPWSLWLLLLCSGLLVLLAALRWDASDVLRRTRRSDAAFWLHVLAAPLIVHPIFAWSGLLEDINALKLAAVFGVYAVFALVSLAIDRRALLLSALGYVLFALYMLFKSRQGSDPGLAATVLLIGSVLLMISVWWHPARRRLLSVLPPNWQSNLAPAER